MSTEILRREWDPSGFVVLGDNINNPTLSFCFDTERQSQRQSQIIQALLLFMK